MLCATEVYLFAILFITEKVAAKKFLKTRTLSNPNNRPSDENGICQDRKTRALFRHGYPAESVIFERKVLKYNIHTSNIIKTREDYLNSNFT